MQTWLGAGTELTAQDVDTDVIAAAAITYLEGYLWDSPTAKEAFFRAARIAHDAGRRVSLTLSDPLFVDRHREELLPFVREHVDVLFANQDEAMSLYQVATFDEALQHVRADADIAAITRSAKGSVLVAGDEVHVIDAEPVVRVVDTTGAGDLYASGMLYGLARGFDLATCGRIGSIAAAEVISHIGARPEVVLSTLANEKLGSVRERQS
jgi:sugar/nucleoside kinase (ribokinase family)